MEGWKEISDRFKSEDKVNSLSTLLPAKASGDKVIWSIVAFLVLLSLLAVYSATGTLAYREYQGNTSYFLLKQIGFILLGVVVMYYTHRMDYRVFSRLALWLYILSLPLLLYTLLFGASLNEASRWIVIPFVNQTIQSSEVARLALFMYLARQLSRKQAVIHDFKKGFIPLMVPIALTCLLIAPANLSTALLTGATGLLLLFLGRVPFKHLMITVFIMAIPVIMLIMMAVFSQKQAVEAVSVSNSGTLMGKAKQTGRIGTWVSRIQDFMYAKGDNVPHQLQQAKIAVAKGGWFGLGPGNSEARNFLPHPYSDFIFSIIVEEYGVLGGFSIMMLYMVFLYRCILIIRKSPKAFGAFLALALSMTLVIQALINMAVNVGLFPITGVTLPLVSMGGTSFLFTSFAIGIILSVSKHIDSLEGNSHVPVIESEIAEEEEVSHA